MSIAKTLVALALTVSVSVLLIEPAFARDPAQTAPASVDDVQTEAIDAASAVDAFHVALEHGDTEVALALLADDVLIFESGEAERSKAEYAQHHLAADAAFSAAVPSIRSRRTARAVAGSAWIARAKAARPASSTAARSTVSRSKRWFSAATPMDGGSRTSIGRRTPRADARQAAGAADAPFWTSQASIRLISRSCAVITSCARFRAWGSLPCASSTRAIDTAATW